MSEVNPFIEAFPQILSETKRSYEATIQETMEMAAAISQLPTEQRETEAASLHTTIEEYVASLATFIVLHRETLEDVRSMIQRVLAQYVEIPKADDRLRALKVNEDHVVEMIRLTEENIQKIRLAAEIHPARVN